MTKPPKTMTAKEDMLLYRMHMEGKNRHEIYLVLRRGYDLIKDSYKRQGLTPILPPKKRYDRTTPSCVEVKRDKQTTVEKTKIDYATCSLPSVEMAKKHLSGRVSVHNGAYYLDGKLVTVLRILEEANTMRLMAGKPLLGYKHSQWRQ